uniref:DUF4817 domain-containing protein n=1 Tax=Strongyloides stercoralis TaxID=6248 RepID=A0AAF5DMY1_STRER
MIYFASFKIVILILLFLTFSCNTIKLNNEQRTKIVELYREHGCKISVTQREFKNFYNLEKPPNRSTVKNIVEKFNKYGNVADLPRSGRPKTARTDDNIERVRESKAKSVIVWCGVTSKRIIGPYFFEDEDGQTVTVNGLRYREMIQNFLVPQLEGEEEMWFQQSGSPSHTTKGYLKDQVYKNRPKTIDELKDNIEEEIGYIQQDTLKKVMENVLERVKKVRELNGKYLGDIIFRS